MEFHRGLGSFILALDPIGSSENAQIKLRMAQARHTKSYIFYTSDFKARCAKISTFMPKSPKFCQDITPFISATRWAAFSEPGDADWETLARYLWNARLCEAFYPALQTLEVCLRNTLHQHIGVHHGNPRWLSSRCRFLHRDAQSKVAAIKRKFGSSVPSQDALVSELTFGFWSSLLNTYYEARPNNPNLWPSLIPKVFPHVPRPYRNRQILWKRFDDIRKLRNRVFHHEKILHPHLQTQYHEVLEAIEWICPSMKLAVDCVSGFDHVCQQHYLQNLRQRLKATLEPLP